jgi:hypothetical protein
MKPARNGKWSIGPLAHSALRAPGLVVGLGWESRAPTWDVAQSVNHRPSIPIGRLRVDPGRSKPALSSFSVEP